MDIWNNIKSPYGLILSVPALLLVLYGYISNPFGDSISAFLILFAVLSLPWNIAIAFVVGLLLGVIFFILESTGTSIALTNNEEWELTYLLIWIGVVIGSHINGAIFAKHIDIQNW